MLGIRIFRLNFVILAVQAHLAITEIKILAFVANLGAKKIEGEVVVPRVDVGICNGFKGLVRQNVGG